MDNLGSQNALAGYTGSVPIYSTNIEGQILNPATINPYSILTIPAYWRAINFKADNLTSFPRSVRQNGIPLDQPHRLDRIFRRPNGYQNATQFWKTLFFHSEHYGNGFARIKRPPLGTGVDSLHNFLPDDVVPFRYAPDASAPYDWQQFYAIRSTQEILHGADVLHLQSVISYDGMAALSPTWMFRETYQRAIQQDRYLTRSLMKGTVMRGSIEIPAVATKEQQEETVNLISSYFSGAGAERDVIVLSGGAHLNNATLSMEQSQMIQQTQYTTKQISQITGVPAHYLMDDAEGKYNAIIQTAGEEVVRFTFRPAIENAEDELTVKLLTPAEQDAGYHVHIDPNALLRGDAQTQTTITIAKKVAGIISNNEARNDLGYAKTNDPEDDKLKTLGDSTPKALPAPIQSSADTNTSRELFMVALKPLINDACARVDAKTDKAFERKTEKPTEERTIWANVFAGEQEAFAHDALKPIAATIEQITGDKLDINTIAERYSAAIRKRAADGSIKTLSTIVGEANGTGK